jgi:hypothetical protein
MNPGIFFWGQAVALAVILPHTIAAQTVDFNNNRNFPTPADRRVYNVDMQPLVGTNFLARLVYGPDASNLQPTGSAGRFRDVPPGDPLAGTWSGGTRTLNGFSPGQTVTLAVQVWDVFSGATYETASRRMQSLSFSYTIPAPGAAVTAYYIDNFRGIRPLTCPIPGPLAISETNGNIHVSYATSAGALEISSDLATWTPVTTTGSPYIDPTARAVSRRFYRLNCSGSISRNYVGFHRLHIDAGWALIANHFRSTNNRIPALIPNPPNGTSVFPFRPATGGYSSLTYLGGWEGDDLHMTLAPGEGVWINSPAPFQQTFVGELVLRATNDLGTGFSLISSVSPLEQSLSRLNFPVAEGDEIFQFNRMTGGYVANMFLGGAWEGDSDGAEPVPRLGESFWVRKRAPVTWVQRIDAYSPP